MACARCKHKGYIETYYHHGGSSTPMIAQCPQCKDAKAYSDKVRELAEENEAAAESFPVYPECPEGLEDAYFGGNTPYGDLVAAERARQRGHDEYETKGFPRPTRGKKDGEPCKVLQFRKR